MSNFLDMRWPQCGDERFIDIEATVRVRVCCDGTDADGTHIFDADGLAFCGRCGFRGTVKKFERPDAEATAGAA
jgi:hypothetical protein